MKKSGRHRTVRPKNVIKVVRERNPTKLCSFHENAWKSVGNEPHICPPFNQEILWV